MAFGYTKLQFDLLNFIEKNLVKKSQQTVVRQSSRIRLAVIKNSFGSCQAVDWELSSSRQAVVRQSSGSCQAVIRQLSGSHLIVINNTFGSHYLVQGVNFIMTA